MKPAKILIIDDEATICNGCRLALSEQGHCIDIALTGQSGLDLILQNPYDILLLDLKLPDIDGMEILKTVRMEKPDVYIIMMTGYATVATAVAAMKLGAFDYLAKPFFDDELILTVEKAIQKRQLEEENISLRKELFGRYTFDNIVGQHPRIIQIFDNILKVAPTDSTVLLYGESGTGKELFARAIHARSGRAARQFVAMDCSTLSSGLLESELFGHVKGAFTGAVQEKAGIFEMAHEGTLFLDDIANLNLETQGKLLRVLEACEYKPVGASHFKKTNIRIIAATNQDLKVLAGQGKFRDDLFYRLNVFPIFIPPLRERKDDIPKIAYYYLRHFCRKTGKKIDGFSDDALEMLIKHDWPGNVRQLKNVIERLVILADHDILDFLYLMDHLQVKQSWKENSIPRTLEELKALKKRIVAENYGQSEKAFAIKALKDCGGNISQAAEKVGMQRPNFYALMKKHHISALPNDSGPSD